MKSVSHHLRQSALVAALTSLSTLLAPVGCVHDEEELGGTALPLSAACSDADTATPEGAFVCGQDATVECTTYAGAHVETIHAAPTGQGATCANTTLTTSHELTFFPLGSYEISVSASTNGGAAQEVCSSTLTVVDTQPPTVTSNAIQLWPPNHKYHHVAIADCVTIVDACDPSVKAWFTFASSDEPVNDKGDGNTEPDIGSFDCEGVELRAERQGGSDGRVYTLGWHVEDHAGNAVEGTCLVTVPHDKSGKPAVDSGVKDYVALDPETCGGGEDGGGGGGAGGGGSGGGGSDGSGGGSPTEPGWEVPK